MTLKIGTRGSQLALWQARAVADAIVRTGGPACELVVIRTTGDEPPDPPENMPREAAPALPGVHSEKATFVKEIEDALVAGRIDLAVHSSKDLSAVLPPGLTIGAVLPRDDPRDTVVLPTAEIVADVDALCVRLGRHPRIGTSSIRRAAAFAALCPGAVFVPIRGNVGTRLRKLDAGECDAIVLASAGLRRLGLSDRVSLALPLEVSVPAPGQGIVAVEVREGRFDAADAAAAINDAAAFDALTAERAIVGALGGGCQMPLGAYAQIDGQNLVLTAAVMARDGGRVIRETARGPRSAAASIGQALADALLQRGAAALLR